MTCHYILLKILRLIYSIKIILKQRVLDIALRKSIHKYIILYDQPFAINLIAYYLCEK